MTRDENVDLLTGDWPVAVIDIGSNSVRLVVYENNSRAPAPLYNEKAICRLGEGVDENGRLKEKNMTKAIDVIMRYLRLTKRMSVSRLSVIATAAVREAKNGAEFVDQLQEIADVEVRILSGGREGKLSALGVLSANPRAEGIVGDMGGGSLELVPVGKGIHRKGASLPLGALRLAHIPPDKLNAYIDGQLRDVEFVTRKNKKYSDFHVVGGSWRALARVHMAQTDYPLHILHGYEADAQEMHDLCRVLARQSQKSLKSIHGVTAERAETLPLAALVMSRYIKLVKPDRIHFSSYGLREGVLFSELPKAIRRSDPLIEACRIASDRSARFDPQGDLLFDWLTPLYEGEDETSARLRLASSILCDFGWRVHPEFRPDYALMETLRSPLVGLDHYERGFLALALRSRYTHKSMTGMTKKIREFVGVDVATTARQVGLGLRLALTLTGGLPALLNHCSIKRANDKVILSIEESERALYGKIVATRFGHLTNAMGMEGEVDFQS